MDVRSFLSCALMQLAGSALLTGVFVSMRTITEHWDRWDCFKCQRLVLSGDAAYFQTHWRQTPL